MPSTLDRRLGRPAKARPAKARLDPWQPQGVQLETERQPDGRILPSLTVFLTGRECPFTCVFCDLWRHTTDESTPVGAIPAQIELALRETAQSEPRPRLLKLYNASNFFDEKAVPSLDDSTIARQVEGFERVVVECHAKLIGRRCFDFADALGGRLQVAIGFETIDSEAMAKLNKGLTVDDLTRAARDLRRYGIGLRAFVLIGAPFIPESRRLSSVVETVDFALKQGAEQVILIPLRPEGSFRSPDLDLIDAALTECRRLSRDAVLLDTWDLDRLGDGSPQEAERIRELRREKLLIPILGISSGSW